MANTKTPFFGLGSQGSIGNVLTSQKRGATTLLRTKPTPSDPYSLAQAYQRWLYEDYAYLWTQQSAATHAVYRSAGSRYHLTGFQYWMKYQLTNLPDIVGYWKLDEKSGAIAYDSGRNNLDATIFGATPITGLIDGAQHGDGLNDYINCTLSTLLNFTTLFSIELFLHTDLAAAGYPAYYGIAIKSGAYNLAIRAGQIELAVTIGAVSVPRATYPPPISADTNYHIVVNYDNTNLVLVVNDNTPISVARAGPIDTAPANPLLLLSHNLIGGRYIQAFIDHLIIRDRILDANEITRHSQRRYPA